MKIEALDRANMLVRHLNYIKESLDKIENKCHFNWFVGIGRGRDGLVGLSTMFENSMIEKHLLPIYKKQLLEDKEKLEKELKEL